MAFSFPSLTRIIVRVSGPSSGFRQPGYVRRLNSGRLATRVGGAAASTEHLYKHLTVAQRKLRCNIVTHPMSARAREYFIIGHVRHH